MANRKHQQAELVYRLGQLLGPLQRVIENPKQFDSDEKERIRARLSAEYPVLERKVDDFCRGETGCRYDRQSRAFASYLSEITEAVTFQDQWWTTSAPLIYEKRDTLIDTILSVPIAIDSTIHEAHTPFSTYCLVKDLCSAVGEQIVWLDRYFDQTVFHRYFSDTPKKATITLVTWPRSKCNGKKDEARYDAFVDMSRLFAAERGAQGYCLIADDLFHDRQLRCDDKLFSLGGSVKDIGKGATFTISKLDFTPQNISAFDDPKKRGVELFGLKNASHP